MILSTGGVSASVHVGIPHPPEETPPRSRHPLPLGADTPQSRPPRVDTPWEQTPLGADTPQSRHPPSRHLPWEQTPPKQTPPLGADTPPEQTPPGADTPRSRHPQKQTPPRSRHPPRSRFWHMVNEQPVCILLECIFVYTENHPDWLPSTELCK